MKLNHIDLQVSDVDAAKNFFQTHFGLHCAYSRPKEMALMQDEIGFSLGLSNLAGHAPPVYPPDFHVGFILEDVDDVTALYECLKNRGVAIKHDLREGGPSLYFTCYGPDSIPVEVQARRR